MTKYVLSIVLFILISGCFSPTIVINDKPKEAVLAADSIYFPTFYKLIQPWLDSLAVIRRTKHFGGEIRNEKGEILDSTQIPLDFVPVEYAPRPIKIATPNYPEEARVNKLEGEVWVKMWIDEQGNVQFARILKSSNNIFNEQALIAGINSRFRPAVMNKKPFAVWVSIPFKFKLYH